VEFTLHRNNENCDIKIIHGNTHTNTLPIQDTKRIIRSALIVEKITVKD